MKKENAPMGDIQVSKQAIATIAYQAVQRSYGVVGLASKNIADELANALVKDPTHGIDVEYKDKEGTYSLPGRKIPGAPCQRDQYSRSRSADQQRRIILSGRANPPRSTQV